MGPLGLPELIIILFVFGVGVWPLCRICSKAGYSPWLGLLSLATPLGYIGLVLFLAFAEWPVQRAAKGRGETVESDTRQG